MVVRCIQILLTNEPDWNAHKIYIHYEFDTVEPLHRLHALPTKKVNPFLYGPTPMRQYLKSRNGEDCKVFSRRQRSEEEMLYNFELLVTFC